MGLDYSYVLLIAAADEPQLRQLVNLPGAAAPPTAPYECVTLDFPLDEPLRHYLADYTTSLPGPGIWSRLKQAWRPAPPGAAQPPPAITGSVGGLDLRSLPRPGTDQRYFRFTAATSDMSRLLQSSPSIRRWFLARAAELRATALFLDLEAAGYEVMYFQGQPVAVRLNAELAVLTDPGRWDAVQALCRDYSHGLDEV